MRASFCTACDMPRRTMDGSAGHAAS
jgi:hypothetical protein